MNVLILGGDGYLGWPTSMYFSRLGYQVTIVDNFSKRKIELEMGVSSLNEILTLQERVSIWNKNIDNKINFLIGDLLNHKFLYNVLETSLPEVIIHYAEQPSAPYSMVDREKSFFTQYNNVLGNLNLLFAIKKFCPDAHLIKLGTLGEYGTPNIDIEEGWLDIEHKGRKDRVLFPKKPGSFYHLSKVHDSNNIEFCSRNWGLRCTDLNQGVVYGIDTSETIMDKGLATSFHYDGVFGTVINRFITQALLEKNLTVYGKGNQKRGYLNILDTMKCVKISSENYPKKGEFRVFNQFTESFTINEIANLVIKSADKENIKIKANHIKNPRNEMEDHYYNPINNNLLSLGLKPHKFNIDFIRNFIKNTKKSINKINEELILPSINWNN
jgi:UDP-sulfoquinovose synthase